MDDIGPRQTRWVVIVFRGGSGPYADQVTGVHGTFASPESADFWRAGNLRGQENWNIRPLQGAERV